MEIYIGCSGYNYKDWSEIFYPDKLPKKQWLEYYSKHFNTVEINNTFYRFPKVDILKKWLENTPGDFKFTIKANRYFTHTRKLKADERFFERLEEFQRIVNTAKDKVDCILWQLPGNLHKNIPKIEQFCKSVEHKGIRHVLEFRHESWFDESVYDVLKSENVAFCILFAPGVLPEDMLMRSFSTPGSIPGSRRKTFPISRSGSCTVK
jgi:uncharacterized protein YecE (DUF72 family)